MTSALPEGAWVRDAPAFDVDTVVLDVDGVLVDVIGSFREAVRATVARVQRAMGVREAWTPAHEDLLVFKRAGGFNDDIDLSIALAALGAAGRARELAGVAAAVEAAGGGLRALRAVAPDLPRISGRDVLQVFDDLYWGTDTAEGLIARERTLVPADFPAALRAAGARSIALISGRTPRELDAALRRLAWDREALAAVVTGDVVRKPDPGCLDKVVAACAPRALVYVGDVRDDWELVRRYRAERVSPVPARGILVGDDAEMQRYRPLGVDATARGAEDVPAILAHWRSVAP